MINSLVPKTVSYKDIVKFDAATMEKFTNKLVRKLKDDRALGVTWTKLKRLYGGGEESVRYINESIARADIREDNGLFYEREQLISIQQINEEGTKVSGTKALDDAEFGGMSKQIIDEDWCKFAMLGHRQLALTDQEEEDACTGCPPTMEAQSHVENAYTKMTKSIETIKRHAVGLNRAAGISAGTKASVSTALKFCNDLEKGVCEAERGYVLQGHVDD